MQPLSLDLPGVALLVVDLQGGTQALPAVPHAMDAVTERASLLAKEFRHRGLPVVLITVDGESPGRRDGQAMLPPVLPPGFAVPALRLADPDLDGIEITKQSWGAFHGTGLAAKLDELGVTQVVIVGAATAVGVSQTAHEARAHGKHVVVVGDAVTNLQLLDQDGSLHEVFVGRVFPLLGADVRQLDDVLRALADQAEDEDEPSEHATVHPLGADQPAVQVVEVPRAS